MKKAIGFALCIVAACVFPADQVIAAAKYSLCISPKYKVGDRFRIFIKGKEHQVMVKKIPGEEPLRKEINSEVALKAVCEVLSVDDKAQDVKTRYTVEECYWTAGDSKEEILPAGSELMVEKTSDNTRLTLDDMPLSDEKAGILDAVISNSAPNGYTDDEIMGIKEPVAVGQSWTINPEIANKILATVKFVDQDSVSGKASLKGFATHKGIRCYDVIGEIRVARLVSDKPEAEIEGSINVDYQIMVPARKDPANPVFEKLEMTMHVRARGTVDNEKFEAEMDAEHIRESSFEALSPAETEGR